MFFYTAYGLSIQSDLALPELAANDTVATVADLRVRQCAVIPALDLDEGQAIVAVINRKETSLALQGIGRYEARAGREILVTPVQGADERLVQLYVTVMLLPAVLYQRGLLLLHASAVAIDGRAVAFVGVSGRGKSTTAAALCACGHSLVADDVVAIDLSGSRPVVRPAFPQIKLREDVVTSLGYTGADLRTIHPLEEKRALRSDRTFTTATLPLAAVYVLDEGAAQAIVPVPARTAFQELIRQSYVPAQATDAQGFEQLARLAEATPVFQLQRTPGLPALPALACGITTHLSSLVHASAAPTRARAMLAGPP